MDTLNKPKWIQSNGEQDDIGRMHSINLPEIYFSLHAESTLSSAHYSSHAESILLSPQHWAQMLN